MSTPYEMFIDCIKKGESREAIEFLKNESMVKEIKSMRLSVLITIGLEGQLDILKELLNIGGMKKAITQCNSGILVVAAEHGHLGLVNYLLKFPGIQSKFKLHGHRHLQWAVKNNHLSVAFRLCQVHKALNIPFPLDISMKGKGYHNICDFYQKFKKEMNDFYDTLGEFVPASVVDIISDYAGHDYSSLKPFVPAFNKLKAIQFSKKLDAEEKAKLTNN